MTWSNSRSKRWTAYPLPPSYGSEIKRLNKDIDSLRKWKGYTLKKRSKGWRYLISFVLSHYPHLFDECSQYFWVGVPVIIQRRSHFNKHDTSRRFVSCTLFPSSCPSSRITLANAPLKITSPFIHNPLTQLVEGSNDNIIISENMRWEYIMRVAFLVPCTFRWPSFTSVRGVMV